MEDHLQERELLWQCRKAGKAPAGAALAVGKFGNAPAGAGTAAAVWELDKAPVGEGIAAGVWKLGKAPAGVGTAATVWELGGAPAGALGPAPGEFRGMGGVWERRERREHERRRNVNCWSHLRRCAHACGGVLTLGMAPGVEERGEKRGKWQASGPKPRVFGGMGRAEQRRKGSMRGGGKIAAGAACGDMFTLGMAPEVKEERGKERVNGRHRDLRH